jgi:hypothetical protein
MELRPMFKSDWRKYVPGDSMEESIEFLNSLSWNISLGQHDGLWLAFAGERLLVEANTEHELEAFILGMTIALAVLPGSILDDIRKRVAE